MSPLETSRKDYDAEIAKSKRREGEIKYAPVSNEFEKQAAAGQKEIDQAGEESVKPKLVENNDHRAELQKEYNDTLALIDWTNKLIEKSNADRAKLIEYHMKKLELEDKIKSL